MIELNQEQRQALAKTRETPLMVINPLTNETYVLVPSATYERMTHVLPDDMALGKRAVAILVERGMREYDANDPTLELYQND